jgi:mono/diheme cytochrome c family protein
MTSIGHHVPMIFLLVATGIVPPTLARADEQPPAASGAALDRRYCAACHGLQGRGDGPAAVALSPRPSDLTRLRTAVPDLMRDIDGRRTIRAHGTAEMPVWGEVFEESLIGEPHRRRTALLQMKTLAEYVRDLQH